MFNISEPHTTYHYYKNITKTTCPVCGESDHHLLRYRTYLFAFPLIRTANRYYLVCSGCCRLSDVENDYLQMSLLSKARDIQPIKYGTYDVLDLDPHDDKIRSQVEFFRYNIDLHVKDLKKQ